MNSAHTAATANRLSRPALLAAAASVLVFVFGSVVAKVGYPEWMWLPVVASLLFAPVALIGSLGYLIIDRLARR